MDYLLSIELTLCFMGKREVKQSKEESFMEKDLAFEQEER